VIGAAHSSSARESSGAWARQALDARAPTLPGPQARVALGALALLAAVAGAGCPLTIEPSEDSTGMLVGSPCEDHEDCDHGACLLDMVGGYCTLPCLNEPCPAGSRCVVFEVLGIRDGMCLRSCKTTEDCGRPGYYCGPAHDQGDTVCGSPKVGAQ